MQLKILYNLKLQARITHDKITVFNVVVRNGTWNAQRMKAWQLLKFPDMIQYRYFLNDTTP